MPSDIENSEKIKIARLKPEASPDEIAAGHDSDVRNRADEILHPSLAKIPGGRIAAMGGIDQVNALKSTKVVSMVVPDDNVQSVLLMINVQNGEILSIPFSADEECVELIVLFPNQNQADTACANIQSKRMARRIGTQKEGTAYMGTYRHIKTIIMPGQGFDEAREGDDTFSFSSDQTNIPFPTPSDEQTSAIAETVKPLSESITRRGTVIRIRVLETDPKARGEMIGKIFRLVDRKTEEFQYIGSEITIVATGENAIRKWMPELQHMIYDEEADLSVTVQRGSFGLDNVGTNEKPLRTLRGEAFKHVLTSRRPGLFVTKDNRGSLEEGNRNVKFTHTKDRGRGILEVLDMEVPEETTQGPKIMLGRQVEWSKFIEDSERFREGGNGIILIEGHPGIGKSRLSREARTFLEEINAVTVNAKAEEHERTRGFGLLNRMINKLLDNYSGDTQNNAYLALAHFVGRKEAPSDEIKTQLESFYKNPGNFVKAIKYLARKGGKPLALFMDDLQWCDSESAMVIGALITSLNESDNILIVALARDDQEHERLHPTIERALNFKHVKGMKLRALPFLKNKTLLSQYILNTPRIDLPMDTVLPDVFLRNVAEASGGNPLVMDCMLMSMLDSGEIRVMDGTLRVNPDVDYRNYTEEAIFGNRLDRLSDGRKRIVAALVLFNGEISRRLFEKLYTDFSAGDLHGLADDGVIVVMGSLIRISHDKFLSAASEKYPKTTDAIWREYQRVRIAAEQDPRLTHEITDIEQFKMLESALTVDSSREMKAAALKHGLEATKLYRAQHRNREYKNALTLLQETVGYDTMQPSQKFQVAFGIADASARMGDNSRLRQELATAERHLDTEFRNMIGLRRLECEAAYHQMKDIAQLRLAKGKIIALHQMMQQLRSQLRPKEQEELDAISDYCDLIDARIKYLEGDKAFKEQRQAERDSHYDTARSGCGRIIERLSREADAARSGDKRMPAEKLKVLLETKRFYARIIAESETRRRHGVDADAEYWQETPEDKKELIQEALRAQAEVVETYRRSPDLAMNESDIIFAYEALGQLQMFAGNPKEAIEATKLGAQEALNYVDIAKLAYMRLKHGRMLMGIEEYRHEAEKMKEAVSVLEKGAAEICQLDSGDNHPYYPYLTCDTANAVCHLLKYNGDALDPTERQTMIQKAWRNIWAALNKFESNAKATGERRGIPDTDYDHYFLPTIRFLQKAAQNEHMILETPKSIGDRTFTDRDEFRAVELLRKKLTDLERDATCPEGVKKLLRLHLSKLGYEAKGMPADDESYELDGSILDLETDIRVVKPRD